MICIYFCYSIFNLFSFFCHSDGDYWKDLELTKEYRDEFVAAAKDIFQIFAKDPTMPDVLNSYV